ncbi:hypothetical protein POTOM_052935 [Populus tomentosa]|uniref:Uncharacterized protein n=1 Tax=Populus tomentosa TaxID=118781 RepID=A0A8X7Y529_POPTO|nr:hypothetical protein POTOM_052935 [Populus tomentosa]
MGAASAIREVLYSLWRLHVNWFGTQESAYLGRESLNRIHWVLVHTMNNDAFNRFSGSFLAHLDKIGITGHLEPNCVIDMPGVMQNILNSFGRNMNLTLWKTGVMPFSLHIVHPSAVSSIGWPAKEHAYLNLVNLMKCRRLQLGLAGDSLWGYKPATICQTTSIVAGFKMIFWFNDCSISFTALYLILHAMDQMLLAVPSNDQSWNWLSLEALRPSRWLSDIDVIRHHNPSKDTNNLLLKSTGMVYSGYANSRHRQQFNLVEASELDALGSNFTRKENAFLINDGAKRVEDGIVYLDATIHLPLFLIFCYYFPCIRGLTNTFDGLACLRELAASCSSFSTSLKSSGVLDLMKAGSPSMRRSFDTEHTSLATHFQDSGRSPIINPIPLWGSDTDPWASIRQAGTSGSDEPSNFTSGSGRNGDFESKDRKAKKSNHRLTRKKSFRRLPGLRLWRFRRSSFRLRLRRLRIMICGKIS